MLPTIPRCDSRSMKSSETRPSSRRATRVSWGVLLTMMSLVMEVPVHEPRPATREVSGGSSGEGRGGTAAPARAHHPVRGGERLDCLDTELDTEGDEGGAEAPE